MVSDRAQKVFASQNTINISRDRSKISDEIRAVVAPDLEKFYRLDVKDVQIPSISYSDSFNDSISEAMKAKNASIAAQNVVQQKEFEGQQIKITADANAYAARAAADATAYATQKTADAQAYAIERGAKAFGGNYAAYNANVAVRQWHGEVPSTMLGGSMPFLSLPAAGAARTSAPQ
jgi:regulator of protease activity HflC (stomatin/prohibitin superfamily)